MATKVQDHRMADLLAISWAVAKEGGEAEQHLRDKCRWEQMSRTAVIAEWGDPRGWK